MADGDNTSASMYYILFFISSKEGTCGSADGASRKASCLY